jgi:hypothetical protein
MNIYIYIFVYIYIYNLYASAPPTLPTLLCYSSAQLPGYMFVLYLFPGAWLQEKAPRVVRLSTKFGMRGVLYKYLREPICIVILGANYSPTVGS